MNPVAGEVWASQSCLQLHQDSKAGLRVATAAAAAQVPCSTQLLVADVNTPLTLTPAALGYGSGHAELLVYEVNTTDVVQVFDDAHPIEVCACVLACLRACVRACVQLVAVVGVARLACSRCFARVVVVAFVRAKPVFCSACDLLCAIGWMGWAGMGGWDGLEWVAQGWDNNNNNATTTNPTTTTTPNNNLNQSQR